MVLLACLLFLIAKQLCYCSETRDFSCLMPDDKIERTFYGCLRSHFGTDLCFQRALQACHNLASISLFECLIGPAQRQQH